MLLLLAQRSELPIVNFCFIIPTKENQDPLETKSNVSFRAQNRPTCPPPPLPQHGKTSAPFPL